MPRLLRLALALALFTFPVIASAQTPTASTVSPSKDTVLFDFDSGNYEGWTLSGDCWNTQPATAITFVDKQGNSLVTGVVSVRNSSNIPASVRMMSNETMADTCTLE